MWKKYNTHLLSKNTIIQLKLTELQTSEYLIDLVLEVQYMLSQVYSTVSHFHNFKNFELNLAGRIKLFLIDQRDITGHGAEHQFILYLRKAVSDVSL